MRRNDGVLAPPPPPFMAVQQSTLLQKHRLASSNNSNTDSLNPSIIVTVVLIVSAVIVAATIYLFHRCFSLYRRLRGHHSSTFRIDAIDSDSSLRHIHGSDRRDAFCVDSLPLFAFSSLTGSISGGDCAVCLSKFEPHDQLRLLPVCCHAFHADCIDAWLVTNHTCPLCRSSIFVSESEIMSKILASAPPISAPISGGESFRVEIGSVSRRHRPSDSGNSGIHRRSYSIGSFEYILDDVESEVTVSSIHGISEAGAGDKSGRIDESSISVVAPPLGETLAAEVAGGRSNWLKDYVDRIARTASFSVSSSFRGSGRFFVGSSRRTEAFRVHEADLEASRLGDEIGEMFRWLSTV